MTYPTLGVATSQQATKVSAYPHFQREVNESPENSGTHYCFGCGTWYTPDPKTEYAVAHGWDSLCHMECCPGDGPECKLCSNGGNKAPESPGVV